MSENRVQKRDELTEIIITASEEWLRLYGRMHLHLDHKAEHIAGAVANAGYRKQSEGEWQIKSEIHQMLDDVDEELYVECPFCQRRFWVPYGFEDEEIFKYAREHYPYCNCGAKMKGGAG